MLHVDVEDPLDQPRPADAVQLRLKAPELALGSRSGFSSLNSVRAVPLEGTTENATDFFRGGADALPVTQVWLATGAGKQRLVILPEHRMVAVRQTRRLLLGERSGFSDVEFLRLLLAAP